MKNKYRTLWETVDAIAEEIEREKVRCSEFLEYLWQGIQYGETVQKTFKLDRKKRNGGNHLHLQIYRDENGIYEKNWYVL